MTDGRQRPPALEVINLSYSFKNRLALESISFVVANRSLHGFVGSNGAGKTTTLKVAATLLRPQGGGRVKVAGFDTVRQRQEVCSRIGFMPDHFGVYKRMQVHEYLDFFAAAYGITTRDRRNVIDGVLELTDLDGRRNDLIHGLSRGMQQRLNLARALINDPKVLLLDEPASGLDPRARIELMAVLRELRSMGKTIFISSHILSELADLCDSVTFIDRGRIKYTGSMTELLAHQGEHALYLLGLASEPDSGMLAAITELPGVVEVESNGSPLEYRIRLEPAQTTPSLLLQGVLAAGGEVCSFHEDRRHLNQVFLDLTEPGVRE